MKNTLLKNNFSRYLYSRLPQQFYPGYYTYKKFRSLISATEKSSDAQINEFQYFHLKKIINYTWSHVCGYRELWEENNFNPEKLKSIEDIQLIPFITKELLRDNLDKFTNKNLKSIKYCTTGGSTAIPFGFYEQRDNQYIENAFIFDIWNRKNNKLKLNTLTTILRGAKIDNGYHYNPRSGLILSSYDLNPDNVKLYIQQIEKYKTLFFQAYPSAIYLLAKIMQDNNLKLKHKFKSLMLGSEPLYEFQRELLNKIFNTAISHWYGHAEKVVLAGNCEYNDYFHIFPQYGITEILGSENQPVTDGNVGELVGTGFWNFATPFIRYRTKDFAELAGKKCPQCHRNYRLLKKVDGRAQEFIISKSGKLISMTAINMHDDIFDDLLQFRFYQDTRGVVAFQYVPKHPGKVRVERIYNGLKAKLTDFDLSLNQVTEIPRTGNGKLRFLDQKLSLQNWGFPLG
ncbi:MAG TPA: hypothetical protein PLP19_01430 [bacterium]|nr:hypothetical protein [bacterium]HPN42126.1 hypothetical protein [bacterium]